MKTRYKILIIILIAIPISVLMTLVIQSIQYNITISQFEEQCKNLQEMHNQSNGPCMWPGGPPHKPILEIPSGVQSEGTILDEPNFWPALAFLVAAITMIITIAINAQYRNQFFRKEYRDEINNVLSVFEGRGYEVNQFRYQLNNIPLMTRRLLQHIHTSGNVEFYEKLRSVTKTQGGVVSDSDVNKITNEFGKLWKVIQTTTNPDFGACELCVDYIKLKKVSKHKKFLKNSDSSMWDPIE